MKKIIVLNIAALLLLLSGLACSEKYVAPKPTDNHTYTAGEIQEIARKFDPDCRQFAATSENGSSSG
jgi:hypothetical protein